MKSKFSDFKNGVISEELFNQSLQSYYGMLKHCNGYKLKIKMSEIAFDK